MLDFVQNLLDGLEAGAGYALLGLGFTLIFGVLRRMNLAFGAAILFGAYGAAWLAERGTTGLALLAAATVAGSVLAGTWVERLAFAPHAARCEAPGAGASGSAAVASMAASFALWMQLEELANIAMPRHLYAFPPLYEGAPITLGPWTLRVEALVVLGAAGAAAAGVWGLLYRTRFGLAVRALVDSPRAAALSGIDVPGVSMRVFALASALGGLAGWLVAATHAQVTPMLGMWSTLKGLLAMMLGGLGSLPGALLGGLALGLVEAQAQWFLGPQFRDLLAYLLLFALLAWRPSWMRTRSAS